MLVAKDQVVIWHEQGIYRVGYTAFGTMVWAEQIADTVSEPEIEPPHIVVSQDGKTQHYFFKLEHIKYRGQQVASLQVHKGYQACADTYSVRLTCGCSISNARFYRDGRELSPVAQNTYISCRVHYDA